WCSFTRPCRVFIIIDSPRSSYHIVVWCGVPSRAMVASTAKCFSCRNCRTESVISAILLYLPPRAVRLAQRPLGVLARVPPTHGDAVHHREHLCTQQIEGLGFIHIGHAEERLVDTHLSQVREVFDGLLRRAGSVGAVARDVQHAERRLLDLVVGSTQPLAVG